jgi:oligopeptide/dipeptide ABC transporter ATP-binding protein
VTSGGGTPLLEVRGLDVRFRTREGVVHAVRGVDLDLPAGGVLGLVGESGSGKSVAMLAVMGLLPRNASVSGSIRLGGQEVVGLPESQLRHLRGGRMAMIFQDPMTSLNPVLPVGFQVAEAVRVHHREMSRREARRRAVELLDLVSIPQAAARAGAYPFEFSGGMRQRVMIAMAIANDPALLIADEPTTALDVTIQAQILEVLEVIQRERHVGVVLITHDLGVVAGSVGDVAVMYAGRIVERGRVDDVFETPSHPYTRGLLACLPRLDQPDAPLTPIGGVPPSMQDVPRGCAFHPRCPYAEARCEAEDPALRPVGDGWAACHFAERAQQVGLRKTAAS